MSKGRTIYSRTRGDSEYDPESALKYKDYLSAFQIEKFTFMFNSLFDFDKNGYIEEADFDGIVERMRKYTGWEKTSENYQHIVDVHKVFFECLQDQVRAEKMASAYDDVIDTWKEAMTPEKAVKVSITLSQWLNMWGKLCYGSAGLNDFPIWVQLLPKIYFLITDCNNDQILDKEEFRRFYKEFVGVSAKDLPTVTDEGFRVMTAGGDYKFNYEQYCFIFANFLLGKGKYGPGKYIFGCFDNSEIGSTYQVCYNDEDEEE